MHGSERTFPLLESAICGITRAQNCVVGSFQNVVAMGVPKLKAEGATSDSMNSISGHLSDTLSLAGTVSRTPQ